MTPAQCGWVDIYAKVTQEILSFSGKFDCCEELIEKYFIVKSISPETVLSMLDETSYPGDLLALKE